MSFSRTLWCVLASAYALTLIACGGGGGSSSQPPPVISPPPDPPVSTAPDLTQNKLLSDAELSTEPIQPTPRVLQDTADWIMDNHHPIRSITYDLDFSDLIFLKPLIGERPIVQLGESSHGTREFNHVKTRLIKFLHQEMGFSVVAFESGFYEGYQVDLNRQAWTANQLMGYIFGVWNTNEVYELFRYIQDTQSSANPLRLAGFDVQISSPYYTQIETFILSTARTDNISTPDKEEINRQIQAYRTLTANYYDQSCYTSRSAACGEIIDQTLPLRTTFDALQAPLDNIAAPSTDEKAIRILLLAAMDQLTSMHANHYHGDIGDARDKGMADTFRRLRSDLFPNEKIVIWAHNRHIAEARSDTVPLAGVIRNYAHKPLGGHLQDAYGDDLYSIGLYMLRGHTAGNDRTSHPVSVPRDYSLEAIAHSVRKAALYIDTSLPDDQLPGNRFIFEPTGAFYWGGAFGGYTMVPRDNFDGILVIDRSSVPSYR